MTYSTRRAVLQQVAGLAALCAVFHAPTRRAQAEIASTIAALETANAVLTFLSLMQQRGDPLSVHYALLVSISRQLQSINAGLQQVLAELRDLKYFIRNEAIFHDQEVFSRTIMGAYLGFMEECQTRDRRLTNGDVAKEVEAEFVLKVSKLYDRVQTARREANFLAENQFHRVALSLCMAWSCETEMAFALKRHSTAIDTANHTYDQWMEKTLQRTTNGSLAWAVEQLRAQEVPSANKTLIDAAEIVEDDERVLRFARECTVHRQEGRAAAIFKFQTLMYSTSLTREGEISVWSNASPSIVDGTMRTAGPESIKRDGFVPKNTDSCAGWDYSRPNLTDIVKKQYKSVAQAKNGEIDHLIATANFNIRLLKSLETTMSACIKVRESIEKMTKIARRPSVAP